MAFLARTRALIFKTFLYQLVMSFFGIMMYTATFRNQALLILGQVLVIAFYFYIFFSQSMQAGSKECEYSIGHGVKSCPWAGSVTVLLGFIPMIVLSLINAIWPPYLSDGSAGAILPFTINKVFQQGVYQAIYQAIFPTVSGAADVGPANALALNQQALLYPFAFLPGWITGAAGFAVGWYRFKTDKSKKAVSGSIDTSEDKKD